MTTPIQIAIEFLGVDETNDDIGRVVRGLDDYEKKIGEAASKTAAMADAVQNFARAAGNRAVAELAKFTGELARSTQAGAELGRMFGPGGAIVGGITGGLLPVIQRVIIATDEAAAAADRMSQAYQRAGEEARRALLQARQQADVAAGVFGADTSDEDLIGLQAARIEAIAGLEREISRLDASRRRDRISEDSTTIPQLRQEAEAARRELANIQREIDRRAAAAEAAAGAGGGGGAPPTPPATRGGARRPQGEQQDPRELGLALLEEYQQRVLEVAEAEKRAIEEVEDAIRESEARKAELRAETLRDQAEAEQRAIEERMRAQEEADEALIRANQEALDAARTQVAEYKEVTDVIVGGLTDALASIIDGSKTAEQAFLGLLSSFLGFIAEKAALSAAEEAAQAIAAYARYDYGSGAQHTAAAVAFGAVAIAAGAGAAATASAAAGAAQSAGPERGRGGRERGGDGGGNVVINWNAPVVSAQTRAQLGRELSQMVDAGRRQYG